MTLASLAIQTLRRYRALDGLTSYAYAENRKRDETNITKAFEEIVRPALEQPITVKVWTVMGDDHDYDANNSWFIGTFPTLEEAEQAGVADQERYWKIHPKYRSRGIPNIAIHEGEIVVKVRHG